MNNKEEKPRKVKVDVDDEKDSNNDMNLMFEKFCASSTIHGTYFWSESRSPLAKAVWMAIVAIGIASATYIIRSSFKGWEDNPVITSVMQKSIEEIPFLAITICPLGNTRFGYVEKRLNELNSTSLEVGEILIELLHHVHDIRPKPAEDDCLIGVCLRLQDETWVEDNRETAASNEDFCGQPSCPLEMSFRRYLLQQNATTIGYEDFFSRSVEKSIEGFSGVKSRRVKRAFKRKNKKTGGGENACQKNENLSNCTTFVRDFRFLQDLRTLLPRAAQEEAEAAAKPGTLLNLLLSSLEGKDFELQKDIYRHFLPEDQFPMAYINDECVNSSIPDYVSYVSNFEGSKNDVKTGRTFCGLGKKNLVRLMTASIHPPHVTDSDGLRMPNPAIPHCSYNQGADDEVDSLILDEYETDFFCRSFQTTYNDHGLCYTYNNIQLGLESKIGGENRDGGDAGSFFRIRKVTGCGKERGLQIAVDSQKLTRLLPGSRDGFRVFITEPGAVSSKVPFTVDTAFHGQHSFFLHGIHHVQASKAFTKWNQDARVCLFPTDRNLTYFSHYSQDNCLLECRLRKLSRECGCSPWYVPREDAGADVCGPVGNECMAEKLKFYKDDLVDRKECNCLNDCEMVHFFSTMIRESYELHRDISRNYWFDAANKSGALANYLLDPKHVFIDGLTKSVLMLAENMTDYAEFAEKRFREDIAVLNFFFDTPIITQINLELRTSVFDMISAIGGTLGLFTGISVITFVEVFYWLLVFGLRFLCRENGKRKLADSLRRIFPNGEMNNGRATSVVDTVNVNNDIQLRQSNSRDYLYHVGTRDTSMF